MGDVAALVVLRLWRCYRSNCMLALDISPGAEAARLSGVTAKSVNRLSVSEEPPEFRDG